MSMNKGLLGQYELQQQLDNSALCEVWKAFDTHQHRYVAIKILHMQSQNAADIMGRFLRGTQGLVALRHPNIAPILDVQANLKPGPVGGEAYIVMEYIEGQSLADYLNATSHQGKFPPPAEIVRLLTAIGAAIDQAHQQGIIHGEIRPSHILLDKRNIANFSLGEPKLIGFGMYTLRAPFTYTLEDAHYISPELAQGYTENARSDLYSLGVILYEMCTGILPFQGDSASEVMAQHIHAAPTSPALINPHLLPALTAVIMRSLAKDPVARFPMAAAMVAAVARALNVPLQGRQSQPGFGDPVWTGQSGSQHYDPMNSPTYLSPIYSSQQQVSSRVAAPAVTNGALDQAPSIPSPAGITPMEGLRQSPIPPTQQVQSPPETQASQPYPALAEHATVPSNNQAPAGAAPLVSHTPYMSSQPPVPASSGKRKRGILYTVLIALLVIVLVGSGLAALSFYTRGGGIASPQKPVVGHAFFVSSGLLDQQSSQGIADKLQIDIPNIPSPQTGNNYYAWLLADNDNSTSALPILVGTGSKGQIQVTYGGQAGHSDLLAKYSRFLITEEDASTPPNNPSLDPKTWRYYAEFSHAPNALDTANHYSLLDHLRHLLAQDPKLNSVGLTGGLDIWLFRNTLKLLEWSGSARDAYTAGDTQLMRRQATRILDYLDGSQYVQTENLPPDLSRLLVDPTIARVALLEINEQNQSPPGYLKHIGSHLREITQIPATTGDQKALAIQINKAANNVQIWLTMVHDDAVKLVHMSPEQLKQPETLALLDHMFTQTNYAFVGQTDPNTNQVKEGVAQIHYSIQRLATFDITACSASNAANPCQ